MNVRVVDREAGVPHAPSLGLAAGEVGLVLDGGAEAGRADERAVAAGETALGNGVPAGVLEVACEQVAQVADLDAAAAVVADAEARQTRHVDARDVRERLLANLEHPRWSEVAQRCLSCANCTLVCPTCFCTAVEDTNDLNGDGAERSRVWDSCFSLDYSYIHGGSIRPSGRSRYRQWMTHKLGTWHDQFDSSGCVGCGRCITWCPVGIDVTEELTAIRASTQGLGEEG